MWPFKKARLEQDTLNEEIEKLLQWTPDAAELEKVKSHNLFVCDQMQPECRDHWRVADHKRTYTAFTQGNFILRVQDLGKLSTPLIFEKEQFTLAPSIQRLPIRGELYKVPPSFIHSLDKVRYNRLNFERKEVMVVIPSTHLFFKERREAELLFPNAGTCLVEQAKVTRVKAWMYFAVPEYWNDLINDCDFPIGQVYEKADGVVRKFYHYDEPPF